MAIVVNLAGTTPRDVPWTTWNRRLNGEPNGNYLPQYAGEIVLDYTNNVLWKAMGVTNDAWVALTAF